MKTIYDVLKDYDRKKIENAYLYSYSDSLFQIPDDVQLTPAEIKNRIRENVNHHIDYLLSHKPIPDKNSVLIAYHVIPDGLSITDDVTFTLICLEDEINEYGPKSYAFELSKTEEIIGYYISDAYTTQYYLTDLLAYFIHESSFFGWEREDVEKETQILLDRAEEVKEGKANTVPVSVSQVFEELFEKYGWEIEKRNKEEEEKEREVQRTIWKYNMENLKREIDETKRTKSKD